jgi:exoribonuclease-2
MIPEKGIVIYKNRPALVLSHDGEKINITVFGGEAVKVREKDIELLHPGPCTFKDLEGTAPQGSVREAWELLAEDETSAEGIQQGIPLKELAEIIYGVFSPRAAWAAWEQLKEGLYFTGNTHAIKARSRAAVEEDEKKLGEKQRETGDRAAFLEKLKKPPPLRPFRPLKGEAAVNSLSEGERRFLQDVEALALGKTNKSRTMKELGKSETPEEAHRLLLASGAWTVWVNPYPSRFGLEQDSAKNVIPPPPEEDRLDLSGLNAYAIDNPWSDDPDDAVSLEGPDPEDRYTLWVHVADPAASVTPGSPADIEARNRGATLYLPEGPSRMLGEEALSLFALGLSRLPPAGQNEKSPALSFKIVLNTDLTIRETGIFPSMVRVTRLSYGEADSLIAGREGNAGEDLATLSALAERNLERRLDTGAVLIDLPDANIKVSFGDENSISVEPVPSYTSTGLVRECMILAGEGAARWALQRKLPFPFLSQDAGELPERRLSGLAGAWQLRRCMRPRLLSARPGVHWGLGLDAYTQVTSPLRRYTDLLCHQQIRAWLAWNDGRGEKPLDEDEILFRAGAGEAAASAASRAEKASRAHWLAVYLSGLKDSSCHSGIWDGVVVDRRGNKGTVIIPALGLETQLNFRGNEEPNDEVKLGLSTVKIPEGEAGFLIAD